VWVGGVGWIVVVCRVVVVDVVVGTVRIYCVCVGVVVAVVCRYGVDVVVVVVFGDVAVCCC